MNGYLAFYKDKKMEVFASTILEAQDKAATAFKVKKRWQVSVVLCQKNGQEIYQSTGVL